ncbi:ERCC4 domain-containing protein [Desulfobacter sp. UBA2225]|uniref:ERCC4 domain-containing protein n=1 Tax=Desulfobacter sp. UBA2225 TaxID=1961413 RepID=UPI00257A99BE|nr:ERCC4 domain-containing protein [Desulfobacter sp. UBA2225]
MIILTDTREQRPYSFESVPNVHVDAATLPTGDYSLPGFEDRAAIERKSISDLIGCLKGQGRERFERELSRARAYEFFAVVIEAGLHQISMKQYNSAMSPDAVLQSIAAFHIRYGVPFMFAGDRAGAEYLTHAFLSKYSREIRERFNYLTKYEGIEQ